jgi:hypothetical protein
MTEQPGVRWQEKGSKTRPITFYRHSYVFMLHFFLHSVFDTLLVNEIPDESSSKT